MSAEEGASRSVRCAYALVDAEQLVAAGCRIRLAGGRIAAVSYAPPPPAAKPLFALPALVNAHDHGRAVRPGSIGAAGKPLERWLHHLALVPSVDPYLAGVVARSNLRWAAPASS